MSKNSGGRPRAVKFRHTLLSRIMLPMIAFAVLQIVVFMAFLLAGGGFSAAKSYSYNTLMERTENRKSYVENLLNQKTLLVYETAQQITDITEGLLAEAGLTPAAIQEDKELGRQLLSACAPSIISLLRRNQVNDAFIILDTGQLYDEPQRQLRPGLYLRDTDVAENSLTDNEDIFMEMGSSETAREYGLTLDSGWSLYLDISEAAGQERDFYYLPLATYASNSEIPLYNQGYWSRVSSLSAAQQGSIKYTLPLVAADGTVYGVVGIGLMEKTIKQNLPASDFLNDDACFILAADFQSNNEYLAVLYSGAFYRRLGVSSIINEPARTVGYNLYEFVSHSGLDCLGNVQELNLYNSGSPYRSQQWALIAVADKNRTLAMYYALRRTILLSIGLTFLICMLSALITSRAFSRPVARMMDKLAESQRQNAPVEFQLSGIVEIDALANAVTDLQNQIAKTKDDEYMARLLEANAALKDSAAAAQQASSAKTDFLSRMSHDIRTPMNAIIGVTAIAEKNLHNPEKLADCLDKIAASSRYLLGLINEVLDMTKIEAGKFVLAQENLNIVETVNNLVTMVLPSARAKGHDLQLRIQGVTHENVVGDPLRLQQIFMNITSNAIKYTPEGGHINISLTERDVQQKLVSCYEMVFEDDGIGMSAEFLARAFAPFERAEDSRVSREQGTGLGLAIVDNIVKLMNGNIQVSSQKGQGSRFTVTIYLRLAEEQEQPPQARQTEAAAGGSLAGVRVLLVDDNELNREVASELLSMEGVLVEMAVDGRQALERFAAAAPGYYDLIFMDVQMPVMNGYEATREIRRLPRPDAAAIPIIAMTANAFAEDVQDARNAGMNEHLAKPIDTNKLYETLHRWLNR